VKRLSPSNYFGFFKRCMENWLATLLEAEDRLRSNSSNISASVEWARQREEEINLFQEEGQRPAIN